MKSRTAGAVVAAICLALTACGQGSGEAISPSPPSVSGSQTAPTQPSATLLETCSQVETALKGLSARSTPPTAAELDAALAQVKLLSAAGDTETRNALSALLKALPGYRDEDPAGVSGDARRAFLTSLNNLAGRCEAVGSSALQ
jgi:hypothetical protein